MSEEVTSMKSIPIEDCEGLKIMLDKLLNPDEEKKKQDKEMSQIVEDNFWDLI